MVTNRISHRAKIVPRIHKKWDAEGVTRCDKYFTMITCPSFFVGKIGEMEILLTNKVDYIYIYCITGPYLVLLTGQVGSVLKHIFDPIWAKKGKTRKMTRPEMA